MNFEENICIDSFKFATDTPIDCRFVVESLKDMVGDIVYYDGCITYIKDIDTYVMHNNGHIQCLNMRQKICDLTPMLSELRYKASATSSNAGSFLNKDSIATTEYLFSNYNTSSEPSAYDNRLRIPYFDICSDYFPKYGSENIKSNANTVFNKYMRGYDCIMDFEHNIYVTKMWKKVIYEDDIDTEKQSIFFKFGRMFDVRGSINAKVSPLLSRTSDNAEVISRIGSCLSAITEFLKRVQYKSFNTDSEIDTGAKKLIDSIKDTVSALESDSRRLTYKNYGINNNYIPYQHSYYKDAEYNDKPIPAPEEYKNISETSRKVHTVESL